MEEFLDLFGVMMAIMLPVSLIVFISLYFDYKKAVGEKLTSMNSKLKENSTAELEQQVADLKDRVQVLEQIVTDDKHELDRKIASL